MQQQSTHSIERNALYSELIDAHCHLDLFDDYRTVVSDSRIGGVSGMITAGGSAKSSMAAISIADGMSVLAVIGIDPAYAQSDGGFVAGMEELVRKNPCVVGVGEAGLDYKVGPQKAVQKRIFEEQIELAQMLDIPIVIHCRQAMDDVIGIVRDRGVGRAMFHYFEGDEQQAARLAEMGNLISIPPIESARRKRVISALDIDSLAAETDSPAVGRNPLDVIKVVEWIAATRGIDFVYAAQRVTQNVKKLFSL